MLRVPANDDERDAAAALMESARDSMTAALNLIDQARVMTDCDGLLDHAIHRLNDAIGQVRTGGPVFFAE